MIEIRPVERSEADLFLRLLCEVFSLDLERARTVFYSEPMFELERKWALFESGRMVSILTTTPLIFGWGRACGIAGVATRVTHQRRGYARRLIRTVLAESCKRDESGTLLFAREPALYEMCGFEKLDVVVRAPIRCNPTEVDDPLEWERVRAHYDGWSAESPHRLRRDDLRWKYWLWHFRICNPFADGYLCYEPGLLRESLYSAQADSLPLPRDTEWYGLSTMANQLRIPIDSPHDELYLMGHSMPAVPQMFMTDQF